MGATFCPSRVKFEGDWLCLQNVEDGVECIYVQAALNWDGDWLIVFAECWGRGGGAFPSWPGHIKKIIDWLYCQNVEDGVEVPFRPSRVILQDFTGVPAVVDFAAMRDAVQVPSKRLPPS